MHFRSSLLILVFTLILGACNLDSKEPTDISTLAVATATSISNDTNDRPIVNIVSPQSGAEYIVNAPILISAIVTSSVGIVDVQLVVTTDTDLNGQIVRTIAVDIAEGESSKQVLLDYSPRSSGNMTLRVIANRRGISSTPADVMVTVRSNQTQITATAQQDDDAPYIDPNDPTCRALINAGLNFRTGPSTDYDKILTLSYGEVLPIIGRIGDNSWWQLLRFGTSGWVSAAYVTTYGNCTGVPITLVPPTPTSNVPTITPVHVDLPMAVPAPTDIPTAIAPSLPNLVINVPDADGTRTVVIPAGQQTVIVTYNLNVTNNGGALEGQFISVARILPSNQEFDAGVTGDLGAGQTINRTVDVVFDTVGTFALQFEVDSARQVQETNEGDNLFTINVTVENE